MLPNLIVIGAQKCGTTSLHYYLSQHPQIAMSHTKELNFFTADINSGKTIEWYEQQFDSSKARRAKVRGESTPAYSVFPKFSDVPSRISALVPNAKLIYLVGDPIWRSVSHYLQAYTMGEEDRDFAIAMQEALDNLHHLKLGEYIYRSRYFYQLSQYLPYFNREQILIVAREDLYQYRCETLQRIFAFLGVDTNFSSARFQNLKHRTQQRRRKTRWGRKIEQSRLTRTLRPLPHDLYYRAERFLFYALSHPVPRPVVDDDLRVRMAAAFQDDVNQLRAFTGQTFNQWSL